MHGYSRTKFFYIFTYKMQTTFVFCIALNLVSALPIKIEYEADLPLLPNMQDLPEVGDAENELNVPIVPEYLIVLPDEIEGVALDEPVQPEIPTLAMISEEVAEDVPDNLNTTELPPQPYVLEARNGQSDPIPPDDIPVMIENGVEPGNNISMRNQIRPGMQVSSYVVEIEPNVGSMTFSGRLVATVILNDASTLEDEIVFHVRDLNVQSVTFSFVGGTALNSASFDVDDDDGLLKIETGFEMSMYTFFIDYTGTLSDVGYGLWTGEYNGIDYLAMNLHATNARRVFPCMDELTEPSTISFTFNNIQYNNIWMNSGLEDNTVSQFKALQGPALLWGMVAHNFNNINNPTAGVQLWARPGALNQENQASLAINSYFNNLEQWYEKTYNEIVLDQDGRMLVVALPDVHKDWYALSTVCIWEPYVLMERLNSAKQRKEALSEMAEAISRQWFGYVIYPENWRFQWVIQGLSGYTASELNKEFQNTQLFDVTLIDFNTIFVTDVIQEALYRDSYAVANPLEPGEDIFDEDAIRDHIGGLGVLKYKSPAIMSMLKLMLGDEDQDFIRSAGQILLNSRSLETVNSRFFVDAINAEWLSSGNGRVDDLAEFLEPWTQINGYPTLHVGLRQGGVLLTQEKFSYSAADQVNYNIPITWTTSIAPNFDDIRPTSMMDSTDTINMILDDDDYVLFNIQGQGYYRVNYDSALWERITSALEDPDSREQIHPLNRATLLDDALNLARAGMLDYDIAFQVVLTMEHEIEYAPWKAFVRNMNFLRKRLEAMINDDDDLDQNIYLRMVRRTVGRVENEIGFYPDISVTEDSGVALTRGLVMDHACRAGYGPCIAAAVDWFWDPDNSGVVNPNIPHEIRPAVYCTMVREGDDDIVTALYDRLEIEPVMYERVVILESLACSRDNGFILTLLGETLAASGPYTIEERNRIFKAVVEASYQNAFTAINFISQRTADFRRMYGGDDKLEELMWHLAENMADSDLGTEFRIWSTSTTSQLEDSEMAALRARLLVEENLEWNNAHLENVYEWIDDNDAPTLVVSMLLILGSFLLTIFNH